MKFMIISFLVHLNIEPNIYFSLKKNMKLNCTILIRNVLVKDF